MADDLHYEELCGSIYLYRGKSRDILRMVDGTDEIAIAFSRENFAILRCGSPSEIEKYTKKFDQSFPGFTAMIELPKGFPLAELNEALRVMNLRALLTKNCPDLMKSIAAEPEEV
jgi:hypothetical protein